jgi:hypothetical protein
MLWESVQARTSPASASGMPMPNETELLEAALMEMLAALPGWEPSNLLHWPDEIEQACPPYVFPQRPDDKETLF